MQETSVLQGCSDPLGQGLGTWGPLHPSDTSVCWTGAIGHCWDQLGTGSRSSSAPTLLWTPGRAAADVTSCVLAEGLGQPWSHPLAAAQGKQRR